MYPKSISFTERVRQAAQRLKERGEEPFQSKDLGHEAEIRTHEGHKKMINAVVHEMKKTGEIVSVSRGRYQYIGRKRKYRKDKMWRVIRAKRTFTLDDLAELSGASRLYCKEFVTLLIRRKVAKRVSKPGVVAVYRLVEDPGPEMEPDKEKAAKLRAIRTRHRLMLEALDRAEGAICEARKVALEMGEEESCK